MTSARELFDALMRLGDVDGAFEIAPSVELIEQYTTKVRAEAIQETKNACAKFLREDACWMGDTPKSQIEIMLYAADRVEKVGVNP